MVLGRAVGLDGAVLTGLDEGVKGGRWPNAFSADEGLFSTLAASASVRQSSRRQDHQLESRLRGNRTPGSEGGGAG